jgi:hypothetical protein
MQQKLVLYIGDVSVYTDQERVDTFKDESVSLTQTIQNVKDFKKIFTEFTQTFSLPASKKNNKIFKHYYNYHISNGFDARKKVKASLELNDIPFKEGKIALTGVDLKNNVPHTYKVTFYGNTVDLKDILGEAELSTLTELNILNTSYDYTSVLSAMQNEYLGNLIVPLITHTEQAEYNTSDNTYGNLYSKFGYSNTGIDYTQFKYAIRLFAIVSAIEQQYPQITFSNDFFTTSNSDFYNLYMWLHRKSGDVTGETQVERVYNTLTDLRSTQTTGSVVSTVSNGVLSLQLPEPKNNWVYTVTSLRLTPFSTGVDYSARVLRNGSIEVGSFVDQQDEQFVSFNGPLDDNSVYTVQIASNNNIAFLTGDIEWTITARNTDFTTLPPTLSFSTNKFSNRMGFTINQVLEFNITEQIPKMKIIDFLTSIFQMFNLTAYVENGIIVVKPLDDYYSSNSSTINIDKYLDTSKSQVNLALPFSEVSFSYEGVGTFLAKQFNQLNNRDWGSINYTLDGDIYDTPNKKYEVKIPFEHMMFERLYNSVPNNPVFETDIQYGYFVNENQQSYIGKPLIFYKKRQANATDIVIRDGATTQTVINNYHIPMNTKELDATTSKVNIHFDNFISEYQANQPNGNELDFTDSLFETQYKDYIEEVFNFSKRLTKVTAYLPYKIFSSLKLNDRIQLGQNDYKINSMTTELTTGKTEFELLNIN